MSDSVENLLVRNLYEVFGERDAATRKVAIETINDRNAVFLDPQGWHAGNRGVEEAIAVVQAQFPDFAFSQIGAVDTLRDYGRMAWAFGPSDEPQRSTGLDVAVVNAGRISALYTFLDPAGA